MREIVIDPGAAAVLDALHRAGAVTLRFAES